MRRAAKKGWRLKMGAPTPLTELLRPLTDTPALAAMDRSIAPEPPPDEQPGADRERFLHDAWERGYAEGQEDARAAFEAEMRAGLNAEYQAGLRTAIQRVLSEVAAARKTLWENQEAEMLALVLDIARQVIKTEVQQNPELILHVLRNALRRVTAKENIRIRVSVSDSARVRGAHDGDLIATAGGIKSVEIIDDRRVGQGGCVIETTAGTIDAQIDSQLSEVARALGLDQNG
jgi:flagellar assembly protein FliH